jgi:hypothetical protein
MNRFASIALHEVRLILAPTIFFFVCFNLLVLTIALFSQGHSSSLVSHGAATVGALVVGKAVLVTDKLPFFNRYPEKPLIYNTVWKALLYVAATLVFRLAEKLLAAATNDYGFSVGVSEAVDQFSWARFWAIQMWLAVLFLLYSAVREMTNVIGKQRLFDIFFVSTHAATATPGESVAPGSG